MRKTKFNPSGHPVLTRKSKNKGAHIKNIDRNIKRLKGFRKK